MKDLSIRNFTLPLYCLVFLDVCTVFYFSKESNTFRVTKCLAGYFAKPDEGRISLCRDLLISADDNVIKRFNAKLKHVKLMSKPLRFGLIWLVSYLETLY